MVSKLTPLLVTYSSKEEYVKVRTTDLKILEVDKPKNFYLTLEDTISKKVFETSKISKQCFKLRYKKSQCIVGYALKNLQVNEPSNTLTSESLYKIEKFCC